VSKKTTKKNVIIITDGTEHIQKIARLITDALKDSKVKICPADKFAGNDLLPADIFIIGCENPNPPSFEYLKEFLYHINLVSRKCGLYSIKEKTLKYLRGIVKDCEAKTSEPLLAANGEIKNSEIKKWLKNII